MTVFLILLSKLAPLYLLIILGFIGGKYLKIQKDTIASILIYFFIPVVIFTGVIKTNINLNTLSIPLLFFSICSIVSLLAYYVAGFIWKDYTRNIQALISSTANTGYFGLPVAVAIFGDKAIGIVALALLGTSLFTNSLGFFLAAKGRHTTKESLLKVFKLPLLYAFILGLIINLMHIQLGKVFFDTANNFNGAFTVLGMMLIGIAIADVKKYKFDYKFIGFSILSKFLVWPLIMLLVISIDNHAFKIYEPFYKILILLSIVPVAANIVSYATVLNTHPEKSSIAVLTSTLFALFLIPIIAIFFLS